MLSSITPTCAPSRLTFSSSLAVSKQPPSYLAVFPSELIHFHIVPRVGVPLVFAVLRGEVETGKERERIANGSFHKVSASGSAYDLPTDRPGTLAGGPAPSDFRVGLTFLVSLHRLAFANLAIILDVPQLPAIWAVNAWREVKGFFTELKSLAGAPDIVYPNNRCEQTDGQ